MTKLTKNTSYVSSLVDFFNDTKPFHSKLTDVVEEYHFSDDMSVRIVEKTNTQTKLSSTWHYQYNSDGDKSRASSFKVKQLNSSLAALYNQHVFTVGSHENTDFSKVPNVYSKKVFSGLGPAAVKRVAANGSEDLYIEGLDYFVSKGGMQLVIKQTKDASSRFIPQWVDKRDEAIITTAQANTRRIANDITNPKSSISIIRGYLTDLRGIQNIPEEAVVILDKLIGQLSLSTAVYDELLAAAISDGVQIQPDHDGTLPTGFNLVQAVELRKELFSSTSRTAIAFRTALKVLEGVILPRDYEELLAIMASAKISPPSWAPGGWMGSNSTVNYVSDVLSMSTPVLYFRTFTDSQFAESGKSHYPNVITDNLAISNIVTTSSTAPGDVFVVEAYDADAPVYTVTSNVGGFLGSFTANSAGVTFVSRDISFVAQHVRQAAIGARCVIRNSTRFVFGPTAPLETWDLIKVNPISYSRPGFLSKRYGYITNLQGVFGKASVNLQNSSRLKTGTVILTCRPDGVTFDLTCTSDPTYIGLAQVNKQYNDLKIGFYIRAGTDIAFRAGDTFNIEIKNELAYIKDEDVFYGYDLDSYDNTDTIYGRDFIVTDKFDAAGFGIDPIEPVAATTSKSPRFGFTYDTRITDYDIGKMGIALEENATTNRQWRLTALPNLSRPIITTKKDNLTQSEAIDLQDTTSGIFPDPLLLASPLFSMLGDVSNTPDLLAYYSDEFKVEYSDDSFSTPGKKAGTVPVNGTFSNTQFGVSFKLAEASKPFIAVIADDGLDADGNKNPPVIGGDIIAFTVQNKPPEVILDVISLSSKSVPKVILHGAGFYDAPPASWSISFTSPTDYIVTGQYTEGFIGRTVTGYPITGKIPLGSTIAREGYSFKSRDLHFTLAQSTGFNKGDTFTFKTYSKKPSYLVHGSSSGWMPEAIVGEPYWNGVIGFEIQKTYALLFNKAAPNDRLVQTAANLWPIDDGLIRLDRLRFDADSVIYTMTPTPALSPTGWIIYRSDKGPIGHIFNNSTFSDEFITIFAKVPASKIVKYQLQLISDDIATWNSQDSIIIRPSINSSIPKMNDKIIIDKRTDDNIGINMTFDVVQTSKIPDTSGLALESIDTQFASLSTAQGKVPITVTSPETAHLRNWIPLSITHRDSSTSIAEFSDSGTSFDLYALGTAEKIGSLSTFTSTGKHADTQTMFTWDATFFSKYLPLSSFTNFVSYGSSGLNDNMMVRVSESLKIMIEPGPLVSDYTLTDNLAVNISEYYHQTIIMKEVDRLGAAINDSPFNGFLPGYDNTSYDDGNGEAFDTGLPLASHFHEARQLAGLDPLNERQVSMSDIERESRLLVLLSLLDNFLVNNKLADTSIHAFNALLNADPNKNIIADKFGYPATGLGIGVTIGRPGISTDKPSTDNSAVGIRDAITLISRATTGADTSPLITFSVPLQPTYTMPAITTYEALQTPYIFSTSTQTSATVEFSFTGSAALLKTMKTPKIYVWASSSSAPVQSAVVTKAGIGKYRITLASVLEAKFFIA